MGKRPGLTLVPSVLLSWFLLVSQANAQSHPLTLVVGFTPVLSTDALVQRFTPLLREWERATGFRLRFRTAVNFETFMERTLSGHHYDVVWLPPHLYLLAHRQAHYLAFATSSGILQGVLVTRRESPWMRLSQLRGKTIGLVDPRALITALVMETLARADIRLVRDLRPRYFVSHNSTLLALDQGVVDVAGVASMHLQSVPQTVRARLRVIARTATTPPTVFAARIGLGEATVRRLQKALLRMHATPGGRSALLAARFQPPMRPVSERDLQGMDKYLKLLGLP